MDVVRWIQVAVGIGLVIFVHEAGHFIAARLCKVRVDCFSLGFGPRLFGWKRGDTTYQIAAVPLGGYVKMAGEESDGGPVGPDDLRAKSVPQRFFIFSGGVLMNVAFGLIVFPIVLSIGVPFTAPVIGHAIPGGPAWHARIEPGTEVLAVNDQPVISFMYIGNDVALGARDSVRLTVRDPGSKTPREVNLTPRYREDDGFLSIDVAPAADLEHRVIVDPDGAAHRAGLEKDDRLLGVVGASEGLSLEEQLDEMLTAGGPVTLHVARGDKTFDVRVEPGKAPKEGPAIFGITAPCNWVADVRENPDLASLDLRKDDRIVSVDGRPIRRPQDLRRALEAASGPTQWVLRRGEQRIEAHAGALDPTRATRLCADLALEVDRESTEVVLTPNGSATDGGLRDGDRVLRLAGTRVSNWHELQEITKRAAQSKTPLAFTIERRGSEGAPQTLELTLTAQPWSPPYYGFDLPEASTIHRASNLGEAIRIGVQSSWQSLVDAWRTLTRIARGDVSSKNIGGIITISRVSYSFSSDGLAKLFFFLCMLSMNLAFLNVLPIPILDGGHLLFLLIEGVKGSPVSERVQGYSQTVGLVMIVSLMIYVTFNDLMRLVGSS